MHTNQNVIVNVSSLSCTETPHHTVFQEAIMAEDEGSSPAEKLTFLLIGAGIGATLALLFAPKSGRELREDIADVTRRGLDAAGEGARRAGDAASELYETGRTRAGEAYDAAKERFGEAYGTARERVGDA